MLEAGLLATGGLALGTAYPDPLPESMLKTASHGMHIPQSLDVA